MNFEKLTSDSSDEDESPSSVGKKHNSRNSEHVRTRRSEVMEERMNR